MRKKCPPPNSAALSRRAKIAAAALCVFSGAPALFAEMTQFTPYSSDDGRYGEITVNPWYGDKELSGGMTSAGETFLVRFGEYIVYDGDYSYENPRTQLQFDSKANSAFLQKFSDSVMRALNTVESTFANKATTPILINCTFAVRENRAGAAANPNLYRSGYKTTWTESDFGGKYAGTSAYINDVEMIYKYGDGRSFANCAVDFTFYAQTMSAFSDAGNLFYAEEDPSGYVNGEYDVETITLHELGHALGFQRNATGGRRVRKIFARADDGFAGIVAPGRRNGMVFRGRDGDVRQRRRTRGVHARLGKFRSACPKPGGRPDGGRHLQPRRRAGIFAARPRGFPGSGLDAERTDPRRSRALGVRAVRGSARARFRRVFPPPQKARLKKKALGALPPFP